MEIMFERPERLPNHVDAEVWQPIKNHPGYLISNMGRVMNATTFRILKPSANSEGYLCVTLYAGGELTLDHGYKRKTMCIHVAVAEAFVKKPKSNERLVVHHLDHNRNNNRFDNLIWLTSAQHQEIHGVTERVKEAKSQKYVGEDENGKIFIFKSKQEARLFFDHLSDDEFTFAYLWKHRIADSFGMTWQLYRVLEIQDGKGETRWKSPRTVKHTKNERRVLDNYLKQQLGE